MKQILIGILIVAFAHLGFAQKLPEGFELNEWAGEDLVANPVAIEVDNQGRVFVAETFRQKKGVDDNRDRGFWLLDDLAAQSVEDRLAYIKKWADKIPLNHYTDTEDRITRLEDTDGDGKADKKTIFSDKYNDYLDGTGAGVLAIDGTVYYTCIPQVWMLPDADDDGVADQKVSLSYGYGVRTALRGHDSHGLIQGPDGRIYYSIGDRGYNIQTKEGKHLHSPGSGAVFRCDPDGSNLELFATGLRNPQELAFDAQGNLWTGDNNSDAGDKARIVYIVEGGETGWHMSYQTMTGSYSRGPWHMDKLWHTQHEGQAAWVIPPIAHVSNGPSGFAYNPGIGLPERYNGHFFLVDFKGSPGTSGVYNWSTKMKGAGFELEGVEQFLWNMLITDFDFGADGNIYLSDWLNGWDGLGKGKIFTLHHPESRASEAMKLTHGQLTADLKSQDSPAVFALTAAPDMRVRQRAQFELVRRGDSKWLLATAHHPDSDIARLHGIWGIGQLCRTADHGVELAEKCQILLDGGDHEVICQAAKLMGEAGVAAAVPRLMNLLKHENNRIKYFAAFALGRLDYQDGMEAILQVLRENNDQDVFLRHGCVMALTLMDDPDALLMRAGDPHRSARLGILLALRRHKNARIAQFLFDADPFLVAEAARAINDLPLLEAMPALAAALSGPVRSESFVRRAINANFRTGRPADIKRLVTFAAGENDDAMRAEALAALGDWAEPNPRDRVLGYYRPLEKRSADQVKTALTTRMPALLQGGEKTQREATRLAKQYQIASDPAVMFELVSNPKMPLENREEALSYLLETKDQKASEALQVALDAEDGRLRAFAIEKFAAFDPVKALPLIQTVLKSGSPLEQQAAYQSLPELDAGASLVKGALADLDQVPAAARLDAVEAARALAADAGVKAALDAYENGLDKSDLVSPYRIALEGGNAERGRVLFEGHVAAQCMRCHKAGEGHAPGGEAGPNLWGMGERQPREYILESLINPSAKIAPGFELTTVTLKDGTVVAGTVLSDSEVDLVIGEFTGKRKYILKTEVASRAAVQASAMPPMGGLLQPREVRDMVEFLATLK
ncbi:MAG: quinoprotein glucose dehydrogenase [Candidatus Omnitrophota bacterium]|jgi:quinoprotein glucose dehydrogenase